MLPNEDFSDLLLKDTACLLACLLGFRFVKYFAQFFHNLAYSNTIFNFLANKKCLKNGKNRFYTDLEHKPPAMRKSVKIPPCACGSVGMTGRSKRSCRPNVSEWRHLTRLYHSTAGSCFQQVRSFLPCSIFSTVFPVLLLLSHP